MKIKELYKEYKDLISYLFFGVCTTGINIVTYWICAHVINLDVMPSTIIAWVVAVLFAYVTNRKWVFHSEAKGTSQITKEILTFFSCRLATGIIDWLVMFIFVDKLGLNDIIIKTLSNIIVIILNYLASKLMVFKRTKTNEEK